ncbi:MULTISPECIES: hypothetical protein [Acidithrix]|uniref:hypothetical protein n=1 Tax=Acidithrix TaxID=1609233 RepID=UPI0013648DAB|nr:MULTISPECIES: hypothetical protein [Acidithrix]CAG4910993.1 unnamed protein product [Acidithrix sp. C25]
MRNDEWRLQIVIWISFAQIYSTHVMAAQEIATKGATVLGIAAGGISDTAR